MDPVKAWLETDIVDCLQTFFIECQKEEHLKDPEVKQTYITHAQKFNHSAQNRCEFLTPLFFLCCKIKNLWEILSGQHRTNAGDEFVNGVKANEAEWSAVLGKTLSPVFYRKMPQRLARRLSAGFQDKESKPQVLSCKLAKQPVHTVSIMVSETMCMSG